MESVKIKVTRRNGETIVISDKGPEFKFGGKMLSETVIASLVFQTVYMNFEKLRDVSDNFEISLTMDYTVHQDEPQANNETKKYTIELTNEEFKVLQKDLGLTDEEIKAMSEEDLARHIISYKCRKTCRKLVKHAAEGSPKSKLANIKKLADAMYYAAQNITTDASRLHKAMDEYHQFIINEYHKGAALRGVGTSKPQQKNRQY